MSSFVLDCSVAVSWCFEDEAADETDRLLERVRDEGAVVPSLWHLELGNVLLQAERRGRVSSADVTTRLDLLADLPVLTDDETSRRALRATFTLARTEALTTYDAAYLELAMRRGFAAGDQGSDAASGSAADRRQDSPRLRRVRAAPVFRSPSEPGGNTIDKPFMLRQAQHERLKFHWFTLVPFGLS